MAIKFYNTLTKKIEEFNPIEKNTVKMYVCGPTVYDYFHIGNARSFIMSDIIQRYFRFRGYNVTYVMNLTDIDDKIINKAISLNTTFEKVNKTFIDAFFEDIKKLKIKKADYYPRATENIPEIINLIQKLIDKGYAYEINGDVFYNVEKFNEYGKLSGKNLEELISGARVEINENKKNVADFALWKAAKPNEPSWDSPWGKGRPGWHIECSIMSMKYLGETFDIHAGGNDLIFPHHENEIAQSEGATGKPFANYWIHFGFLNIDNQKMSKSLGNFFTAREILKEFSAEALRLLFSQTLYSAPLNFSFDNLKSAEHGVQRIRNSYLNVLNCNLTDDEQILFDTDKYLNEFITAMDDNFSTPEAVAVLFNFCKEVNIFVNEKNALSQENKTRIIDTFKHLACDVLDVLNMDIDTPKESKLNEVMDLIIQIRNEARKNKNYALSDRIRDGLKNINIILEDHKDSTTWKII